MNNGIPVDSNLSRLGIAILYKCSCSSKPQEETLAHLFVQGDLARAVWTYFGPTLNLSSSFASLSDWGSAWLSHSKQRKKIGFLKVVIF